MMLIGFSDREYSIELHGVAKIVGAIKSPYSVLRLKGRFCRVEFFNHVASALSWSLGLVNCNVKTAYKY